MLVFLRGPTSSQALVLLRIVVPNLFVAMSDCARETSREVRRDGGNSALVTGF